AQSKALWRYVVWGGCRTCFVGSLPGSIDFVALWGWARFTEASDGTVVG
ncbi:MAG: hypothetical protein QOC83_3111, partial [Pseudonocardiales bacterium]|nr:hypothetical protein [Pseudonocardiales bacterium]